jgi:hypothetical protein
VVDGDTVVVVTAGAVVAGGPDVAVVVGETPLERLLGAAVVDVVAGAAEVVVDVLPAPLTPFEVGEVDVPKVSFAGVE